MTNYLYDAMMAGMRIRELADGDVELDQALSRKGAQIRMIVYEACDMLGIKYPDPKSPEMGAFAGFFSMMESPIDFDEE